ncbi:MFS transporter [Streptomyces sp. BB1-1-1]|uniref:MFS transporter n=1 Tax=Streptomyces sp. BB1-1-1 TaxID=3074430 RepID=UPI002877B7CD|nr:MFS transporter [Streptomyces sp. BB1-1-1]WND34588.1 MFS transporter [Streptomyces sp. BB1-1-1]
MLTVLRNRAYRHLFTAHVVALAGTGLATVALGLLAYDIAGPRAGSVLGTALAIKMVAYVGLAPVIAALAERVPRRAVMVWSDVVRGGVALALPFVDQVWQVYVLVFVLQAASAAFTPAFLAVVPDVLPDERDYTRALSLSRLAYDTESLFSPALAAALLTVTTYNWLFLGTAVGFAASAILVLSAVLPKRAAAAGMRHQGGVQGRVTAGIRLLLGAPALRSLLWMDLAVAAGGALVLVNTVVYVRGHLALAAGDVALALGAYGGGSMVVALFLPRVLRHVPDRRAMLAGVLALPGVFAGAALVTAARTGDWRWPALLTLWAAFGAAGSLVLTPAGKIIRRCTSPERRTAAFAAHFSLSHACWLATYPLAGWLGAAAGLQASVLALAAVALAAAVLAVRSWPADAAEAPAPVAHSEGAHVHANLPATHPHLADAVLAPGGFRHHHAPRADRLHAA